RTSGLAKNKLLVILGVLGAIILSMLMFGVLSADEDKKISADENLAIYRDDSSKNTDQLLQDVISKKQAASAVVESRIVPIVNPKALQMVPPISIVNKELTPEEQAQSEYDKKKLSVKYTSLGAKSLVFSSIPTAVNNKQQSGDGRQANSLQPNSDIQQVNSVQQDSTKQQNSSIQQGDSTPKISTTSTSKAASDEGQNTKVQFMQDSKSANTDYLASGVVDAKSPYEVKAGSIIPAIMINGLNSDLPGQVIAQVRENVYDSSTRRYLLIPQGAKLVGIYDNNIIYGQERILVAWNRLIYQDGSSINLKAMPGTDLEGYAGFYDEVDNKYWKIFGSSFIMGVITGAMQYSQNNTNANVQVGGIGVTTNNNPTVGSTLSGSLGQQLGQTGLALAQKNLNVQPTLIVKPNYPFNIMITADMVLRPLGKS
ncbi:MAG TPA: TrbI/VirB10 family protein, partial [Aquella sp.]|nr:TrbI/VirB10 family protein [Aquella sp.]